ncbi:MAG: cytochrome b/b6 domain-containing protein [Rhizobiales bacterium]|nr:cytochrome b/b6 domain-containing protein [Hyphomicrobiales bacterium]NRB14560.1 cytochrome b/b6 domain-containing protein [Hyphomicrobiales bacterium]
MSVDKQSKTQIWDIYIRIFHWLLAVLVVISYSSIRFFDNLELHFISGFGIIGLLVFRIIWGVFGSETAKFVNFIKSPTQIYHYLKSLMHPSQHRATYGHSPLGALSVMAMLFILLFQVISGLFYYDEDIFLSGPLAHYGTEQVNIIAQNYHPMGANIILALVALHVLAIAVYFFIFKNNLILPMITGWKAYKSEWTLNVNHIIALVCIILAAILVAFIVFFAN